MQKAAWARGPRRPGLLLPLNSLAQEIAITGQPARIRLAARQEHSKPKVEAFRAWHLTRELDALGVYDNVTDYRELVAGFTTRMHDLRGLEGETFLHGDPVKAYPAGQALARALRQEQAAGVLYPSARHEGGHCLAAFRPMLVQNIRQGATWRFRWKGSRILEISQI